MRCGCQAANGGLRTRYTGRGCSGRCWATVFKQPCPPSLISSFSFSLTPTPGRLLSFDSFSFSLPYLHLPPHLGTYFPCKGRSRISIYTLFSSSYSSSTSQGLSWSTHTLNLRFFQQSTMRVSFYFLALTLGVMPTLTFAAPAPVDALVARNHNNNNNANTNAKGSSNNGGNASNAAKNKSGGNSGNGNGGGSQTITAQSFTTTQVVQL